MRRYWYSDIVLRIIESHVPNLMQDWFAELGRSLFVAMALVVSRTRTAAALLAPMPYKN